jgi:NADPH-dependent 7-cyano-7-deazaguanine reductase QueF-like protein
LNDRAQDNIRGKHGGEMASAVYKLVYHGSKIWRSVALNVLNHTAKPIIAMIRAWMLEVTWTSCLLWPHTRVS